MVTNSLFLDLPQFLRYGARLLAIFWKKYSNQPMDNVHTLQNTIQNCIKLHSNPKISEEMARGATYQSNCPPRPFSALLRYFLNFLHI